MTVLFADLVDSTARADRRDPERPRHPGSFYERMRAVLERFGGQVEKFIGDAVMALFGLLSHTRTIPSAVSVPPSRSATRSVS